MNEDVVGAGAESAVPPTAALPFVTITPVDGELAILTNIKPDMAPMVLWYLQYGTHKFLSQVMKQETKLVTPTNGLAGMLRRMGKG